MFNGKIPYIRVGKGRHGKYLISKEGLLQYFYRLNEKVGKWIEREREDQHFAGAATKRIGRNNRICTCNDSVISR